MALIHDPYYDIQAVSNSSLTHINPEQGGSPSQFKANWDGTAPKLRTSSLEFGNLVHLAVLEPHLLKYKVDRTNTQDKIRDIVKTVFEAVCPKPDPFNLDAVTEVQDFESYYPAILSAIEEHKYGANWKEDTRIRKVLESGGSYFATLAEAHNEGSFVITSAMESRLKSVMNGIERDKYGSMLLDREANSELNTEYLNEQEVTWHDPKYAFQLKGKIDQLRIDHANMEFTIIDLKTTSKKLADFHESFEKYHYARQMAAYIVAAGKFIKDKYGKTYKPSHKHLIVAVETTGDYRCGRFVVKNDTIVQGDKEYQALLDRVQFHFETNNWIDDYEYIKHGCYSL